MKLIGPGSPFGSTRRATAIRSAVLVVGFVAAPVAAGWLDDSTAAIVTLWIVAIIVTALATRARYRAAKARIAAEHEQRVRE
jgi:preprotein translocase subunit SecG